MSGPSEPACLIVFPALQGSAYGSIASGNGNGLQATLPPFQSGLGSVSSKLNQKKLSFRTATPHSHALATNVDSESLNLDAKINSA